MTFFAGATGDFQIYGGNFTNITGDLVRTIVRTKRAHSSNSPLAEKIVRLSGYGPASVAQAQYRLDLIAHWPIATGARVLELGCGQGITTLALAEAVGPNGHVDAVDPGPLDHGDTISAGPLGPRIEWVQAESLAFLEAHPATTWDAVVIAHSLWYFATPALVGDTLRALGARTKRICIAEWSLESEPGSSALTHVLAVLAQGALQCRKPHSTSNVHTVVSPAAIKALTASAGLVLLREARVMPHAGTARVVRPQFKEEVEAFVEDEREKGMMYAMRDAVEANLARMGGMQHVDTMDGWVAIFEPNLDID
ncbi:putative SAM-dependent methyltransferase [Mycena maculata]|uniref:SAM-dependent methyltransferase n=1 Tax=Mycena maculata TaxID=230809 RepID=A0AAD7MJ83_9AGAR|nr:putative SAM-dependent methyltransferase [Mycena maculata]